MFNLKMEAALSSGKNTYFLQNYRDSRSRRQWCRQVSAQLTSGHKISWYFL